MNSANLRLLAVVLCRMLSHQKLYVTDSHCNMCDHPKPDNCKFCTHTHIHRSSYDCVSCMQHVILDNFLMNAHSGFMCTRVCMSVQYKCLVSVQ